MKRHIYHRCSTDSQDFAQQQKCVSDYLIRTGIAQDGIHSVVVEKVSGTIKHTERKLYSLLHSCDAGDEILVSELSRLGRNMSDLFALVTYASENGIILIQCKDGSRIENESIGGKALLFALSLAAEIEVSNIRQRTQMGLDVKKEQLKKDGSFVSKSGRVCTKLGRERGCNLDKAREASHKAREEKIAKWKQTSVGYDAVRRWYASGQSTDWILAEFNVMHEKKPKEYCTFTGKPLSRQMLLIWRREMQNTTI